MPMTGGASRKFALVLIAACIIISLTFIVRSKPLPVGTILAEEKHATVDDLSLQDATLKGHAIMPKLGNETAKAELGRAAWKLFHTTFARFPDKPTTDEKAALKAYIHLFQRLYPCGECATHFGEILGRFPPQVSSRSSAAAWGCHVHNEVNRSLNKEPFDCANIGDFYDCGCAEDEETQETKKPATNKETKNPVTDKETKKPTTNKDTKKSTTEKVAKKPVTDKGTKKPTTDKETKTPTAKEDPKKHIPDRTSPEKPDMDPGRKMKLTGAMGRDLNEDLLEVPARPKLE